MIKLDLPYPISVNRYWKFWQGSPRVSKEAKAYKQEVALIAKIAGANPVDGDVKVTIVLHPKQNQDGSPSRTRMDLDNTQKVALDALNGIAYMDDKQIVHIVTSLGEAKPKGGLSVSVKSFD